MPISPRPFRTDTFARPGNRIRVEAEAGADASLSRSSSAQSPWTNRAGATCAAQALPLRPSPSLGVARSIDQFPVPEATGFKFAIPATAKTLGILVSSINCAPTATPAVTFSEQLLYNGKAIGTAHAYTIQPSSPLRFMEGGSANLWNTTLTTAEIDRESFAVAIPASIGFPRQPAQKPWPATCRSRSFMLRKGVRSSPSVSQAGVRAPILLSYRIASGRR